MRWEKETQQRPFIRDCLTAKEKIYEALHEGYIDWNGFTLAMERVDRNMHGDWMFKKPKPEDK